MNIPKGSFGINRGIYHETLVSFIFYANESSSNEDPTKMHFHLNALLFRFHKKNQFSPSALPNLLIVLAIRFLSALYRLVAVSI